MNYLVFEIMFFVMKQRILLDDEHLKMQKPNFEAN